MDILKRKDLQPARELYAKACEASRAHDDTAHRALEEYGDHGPQISGCVRDHFPDNVKDRLRRLARLVTEYSDAARAAKPPRVHYATMRKLSRAVAAQDGSGFYGPQP